MQLSSDTMTILKNFSTINSSLVLREGKMQTTMSSDMTIVVEAEISESLPKKFPIYDLNQFLGNITALSNPELQFSDTHMIMSDDVTSMTFHPCSEAVIVSPPANKSLDIESPVATFDLSKDLITKMMRLGSMNSLPHFSIIGKNSELLAQVHDKSSDSANYAVSKLTSYDGKDFVATFKTENLKLISDDYSVKVRDGAYASFTSKTRTLKYFIALTK